MGSERHRRAGAILNLTPLIDIVFLLLVFFMLTSHFIEDQSIDINLPKAKSGSEALGEEFVEVIVDPEGQLLVNDRVVRLEITRLKVWRCVMNRTDEEKEGAGVISSPSAARLSRVP